MSSRTLAGEHNGAKKRNGSDVITSLNFLCCNAVIDLCGFVKYISLRDGWMDTL